MDTGKIAQLQKIIDGSGNIVFFGGAGVSVESGIPDFRSPKTGIYKKQYEQKYGNYPPEEIISHSFYMRDPGIFYRFYVDEMLKPALAAEPNPAHRKLAQLEQAGKLKAVVTQNIDGLHQKAGSKTVYELHGSVLRNYCTRCGTFYDGAFIEKADGIPRCPKCGGMIKPDVVLYEEGLDENVISGAIRAIAQADVLIIGGTSLVVYPAAGLIDYFRGSRLVLVNKSSTGRETGADLVINDPIGEVFSQIEVR